MHPDLAKLLDLQAKDIALAEAEAALGEVQAAEAALDERLRRAQREAVQARQAAEEAILRRDALAKRIETYRAQQAKRQQRLDAVRNAREATAVMAELDLAKQVLSREEGEWVRSADDAQRAEHVAAEAASAHAAAESGQASERAELASHLATAEANRATAAEAREASARQLDRAIRVRYDRMRQAKPPRSPLVPLNGFTCSACFTAVPVSRRGQIRGGLLLEGCEVCGGILYVPEPTS